MILLVSDIKRIKDQMADYENMTDEQLVRKLRDGDSAVTDFLMEKYKNLVRREANAMYLIGGENEDLIQEGMIGLFKAIRDFDLTKETSFASFAKLCIRRQMYSAIEAASRKKHAPLNSYVSLNEPDEGDQALINRIEAEGESNPEDLLISQEYADVLEDALKEQLSDLENRVLYLHLQGIDYRTIAALLDKSPKTIDNALQRIKNKTAKIIEEAGSEGKK